MHIECVIPAFICLRNYVQMESHPLRAEVEVVGSGGNEMTVDVNVNIGLKYI